VFANHRPHPVQSAGTGGHRTHLPDLSDRDNGIFFLDYVDDNGIRRRKSLHTTIKEEAQRHSVRRNVTLAEAGDEFCRYAQTTLSPKTTLRYKLVVKTFCKFIPPKTLLRDITPLDIERYKQLRLTQLRPVSVNSDFRHLRTLFSQATAWEYIQESPFSRKRLKFLRIPNSRAPYFTPEDFAKLLAAIHLPWLRVLAMLGFHTGMRSGEMLGLRWENADLET
jgi:integrase